MRKHCWIKAGLLAGMMLAAWEPVGGRGAGPTPGNADSIDVVAPGPKFETEPVELNTNVDLEAETRAKDYTIRALPTGAPPAALQFVSHGAEGPDHAAKITAQAGQAGMLTRNVPVDKSEQMIFSVRLRAEGIGSVGLVAVGLPRGPQARTRPARRNGPPPGNDA